MLVHPIAIRHQIIISISIINLMTFFTVIILRGRCWLEAQVVSVETQC